MTGFTNRAARVVAPQATLLAFALVCCGIDQRKVGVREDAENSPAAAAGNPSGRCNGGPNPVGFCGGICGKEFRSIRRLTELSPGRLGSQEPLGITSRGDILYAATDSNCIGAELRLAWNTGSAYVERVVAEPPVDPANPSSFLGFAALELSEGYLAEDGELIFLGIDGSGFLSSYLDADAVGASFDDRAFRLVNQFARNGSSMSPALSGDGLIFTFQLVDQETKASANYQARRASRKTEFDWPEPLNLGVTGFARITALSNDGLTAFVSRDYQTIVVARASAEGDFAPVNVRAIEASVVRVFPSCQRFVAGNACGQDDMELYGLGE